MTLGKLKAILESHPMDIGNARHRIVYKNRQKQKGLKSSRGSQKLAKWKKVCQCNFWVNLL